MRRSGTAINSKNEADAFRVCLILFHSASLLSSSLRSPPSSQRRLRYWRNAVSFITQPGDFTELVARAVQEVTGVTPALSTSGGTSDARFITHFCPVLEFGLTNETIHAVDENARIADIDALCAVYLRVLERYFGR